MQAEKLKILVVDDEPDIVAVLRDFLAKKGYEVMEACSGEEALNILDKEKMDLVLLDLQMPGLKGTETARIIKEKYPSTKVMILTGYPDMGENLLYEDVLDGFLTKPIRMQELFDKLLKVLDQEGEESLDFKPRQQIEERGFWITARLLIVEPSLEIYNFLEQYFRQLSKKGKYYLLDAAGSEEQIKEKLKLFKPDMLLVNTSFFKEYGKDIILDALAKNSQIKEVLVYDIDDIKKYDEKKLERLTKNVELTCFLRGFIEPKTPISP